MPIRSEYRKYYRAEWRAYRLKLIEMAQNRCSICQAELPAPRLTGMHVTHDPRSMELVAVTCFECHARHDAPHRVAMMRRTRAKRVGQLWLLPELEYAPFPTWMIPKRIIAGEQRSLFD